MKPVIILKRINHQEKSRFEKLRSYENKNNTENLIKGCTTQVE